MDYYIKDYLFPWEKLDKDSERNLLVNVNLSENHYKMSLNCVRTNYENIEIPNHIEYLEMDVFATDVILYKILDKIHIPKDLKGLCLIVNHRLGGDCNTNADAIYYSPSLKEKISLNLLALLNDFIPSTIEYVKANFKIYNRPWNSNSNSLDKFNKLRCLVIDDSNIQYLGHITNCNSQLDDLPGTLERLHINYPYFTQPLNNLPSNLKVLTFNNYDHFGERYVHLLDNLPSGLEVLVFPRPYDIGNYGIHMDNDDDNDDNYDNDDNDNIVSNDLLSYLPVSLKYLSIPCMCIYKEISLDNLPNSLEYLEINNKFTTLGYIYEMSLFRIPDSLRTINILGIYDEESINVIKQKYPYLDIL